MIVAYPLHRFHQFVNEFTNPEVGQEFDRNHQAFSEKMLAQTNAPLINPLPLPGQTETARNPDVSSILETNAFRIEKIAFHGPLLNYYLLSNSRSGKVCHIIVNDCYCGRPRALFRNAAELENITFCYETLGKRKDSTIIFDNAKIGEVRLGDQNMICKTDVENFQYCWVNPGSRDAASTSTQVFQITKADQYFGRFIFDHESHQVTIEFIRKLNIYWRILIISFALKKTINLKFNRKRVERVSGLDDVMLMIERINQ